MKKDVLDALAKPFNLKKREGLGGKVFTYVASEDIVDRMNTVFEGKWNVELRESQVVEEQLLVLVRVSVVDEETGNLFFHDGYASYPIFRFTSGQNQGKIIDIGNSYRSAMSKAIKTACSRWGVALFLEEGSIPAAKSDIPVANTEPAQAVPDIPIPAGPIDNPEEEEIFHPWPDSPPPVNEPVFTDNNVVAPDPGNFPSNVEVSPLASEEVSATAETAVILTPVQKVAIESLMEVNKIKFKDLFMKAIPGQEVPSSIKEVSYLDAVKLIQCGNHLKPVSNL